MYTGSQANYANLQYKTSSMANGNPEMTGGVAKMATPYGTLNIPNPWAQTLAFRQSWNQGRWSTNELGVMQGLDKGMNYGSVGAIQGYVDSIMSKYPQLKNEGFLNPYRQVETQLNDANARLNQLRQQSMNRIETASAGQANVMVNPLDSAIKQAEQEVQNLARDPAYSGRRAEYYGSFQSEAGGIGLAQFENMRPTQSNLPIVEKYLG